MTKGEGRNEDWPVDRKPSGSLLFPSQWCSKVSTKPLPLLQFSGQSPAPKTPHSQTRPQDTWTSSLGVRTLPFSERTVHWFPTENHGVRFRGADPHPSCSTLGCEPVQWELKVTDWWCNQDHIICKKQRCDPETTDGVGKPPLPFDFWFVFLHTFFFSIKPVTYMTYNQTWPDQRI